MASFCWSRLLRRGPVPPCRRRANPRIALEFLEDRTLPSVDLTTLLLSLSPAAQVSEQTAGGDGASTDPSGSSTGGSGTGSTTSNSGNASNGSGGGDTSQGSGGKSHLSIVNNVRARVEDLDPNLVAAVSRLVGSGTLAALVANRIESILQGPAMATVEPTTLAVAPLSNPTAGSKEAGAGAAGTPANEAMFAAPSRAAFFTEGALGLSSSPFAATPGALRFQGIDFRPLNSSGVGVVGTVLAGGEGTNPQTQPPAAAQPPTQPGGPPAENRGASVPDASLNKFLLGVEPPALPASVPGGMGRAPAWPAGPTVLDEVFAGGFVTEETEGDDTAGTRATPVALLMAPFVYLQWFPRSPSRRKQTTTATPGSKTRPGL